MAALGKIRSRGVTLIIIIGLGLFAFIAEEAFRSCNGIKGEARQQIGEVLGEKINVQDFQELVDEYQNAVKFTTQRDNLSDDELNQVKDQVWQQLVSNKIIENDADKLGLTVTDGEIQNVLAEGTNQMLRQTPFINQQTGLFDVNMLKQFLNQYKQAQTSNPQMAEQMETVYNYWLFVEKNLRSQLLQQKYQVLLASCILSNKVEAQMAFKDENEEAQVQLASIAYSTIKDADVKVTDEDLKAKYEELKPAFYQPVETRDLKYVDFQIKASAADRAQLLKEMSGYQKQLATVTDPTQLVSRSTSQVPYLGVPVSSSAFPQDIATKLDSMAVGTTGVYENKQDNTFNIIRIYSKSMLPDSVQFRQIQVAGASIDESRAKADSIQKALAGGAKFEDLAKKYGQTGEKIWFTGAQYEHATSMSQDNKQYIEALLNGEVNATQNLALAQGNVILQVLDKKGMKEKFNAAVIKKVIDFSKATRSKAYNNFSEFVTRSTSLAELQKNASKFGYQVQDLNDFSTAQHNVGGVGGAGIRDAIKWIFSANEGEVSPLFEAGNNDHMLVMVVTHIHPQGYRPYDDPQVKEILTREVIRDKKAEMIMAKLKGVNSIAAAKAKGAKVSTVDQITFASPAFIPATGAAEPAVSGAVAATKAGQFCKKAIKGNAGVYMIQVLKKSMRAGAKFDVNAQMQRNRQQYLQSVGNFMQDLMLQAKVVDNRYLYF
ncbi:MAG: SurA N-terminal domain-containing protein [Prevotella sp.]|nr:SurA N-terminal domain-containing protein [Prevotella sp.]MDY5257867.1 peptidylprolyl isomerase [Prevotella sp.]